FLFSRASAQESFPDQQYISIRHDNDLLNPSFHGTDEYYTAGLDLRYGYLSSSNKNILKKILFAPGHPPVSFMTIGISQKMYTPENLKLHESSSGDYPYSGELFLNFSREIQIGPKQRFRSELWLGTMGPPALTRQTQMLVHRIMDREEPEGWKHQLPAYPIINYNLYYEPNLSSPGKHVKINGFLYTQTGSLLNAATAGIKLLVSRAADDYFPERVYEPDEKEHKPGKVFLELIPAIEFMAYNSILQGGLFARKNYYHIKTGDLERIILKANGMIGFRTGRFLIFYEQLISTREFKTVHAHNYGAIAIVIKL
ncbi:MAG: lipid A deacylase LpxR family protein, partial [Ginsengibacter sp.]